MTQRSFAVGRRRVGLGALLGALALLAPAGAAAQEAGSDVTFARDVAPILQQKCETCHRVGSVAPMSLVSYEETRPWARSIKARVQSREMPPWHLDKTVGIQHFINDRSLTDAQIDTIVRWVDAGAPLGDPADLPPPVDWPAGDRFELEDRLGPPDIVVRSQPWTMPADGQDAWFRPRAELNLTAPVWVRAAETRPSLEGRRIVHHASTYLHQPKGEELLEAERALRAGQVGVDAVLAAAQKRASDPEEVRELFTEWAQGKQGEIYPDNVGKLVRVGSHVEFDIHYHAVGEEITDQLEVGWWLYPQDAPPKYSAQFVAMGAGAARSLEIPPRSVVQHQGTYVLPAPAILHNFQPHMHYRGKAFLMEALHPDGRREVINYADRFDNTWHLNYIYDPDHAPVLPKGTVMQITTWHDNTRANRNNPDPRQWVSYGPRTVDEMAHANQQVIFITEEDYERIAAERKARAARTDN